MEFWSWNSLSVVCFLLVLVQYGIHGCLGCLEEERVALLRYKAANARDSEALLTWVDVKGSDCCGWAQVKCSNTTGRVIQLTVNGTFTTGILNSSLFLPLQQLQLLDLSFNYIGDWEHNEGLERLSKLQKLEVLKLGRNQLNNSVLPSLGTITSLKTLDLSRNNLDASLPEFPQGFEIFSKLKKLEALNLNGNYLNTTIVPVLGALTSLKSLDLSENRLEGSLAEFSPVFTNLSNLEMLDISGNLLDGFRAFHGSKTGNKLKLLDLSGNNFFGRVPPLLLSLKSIQALSLRGANLKDSISGFCKLKNLRELDLAENKFEGSIPPCLNNLTSLRTLDLSNNQLSGKISPSQISNLQFLQYISLSQNHFEGTFSFKSFTYHKFQLRFLGLSDCNILTPISDILKFLHNQYELRHVDISHNNIHGEFPNWLAKNNTRLETLVLTNNSLSSYIHFPLRTSMHTIDVSDNHIQGQIQTNFGNVLPELLYLNISHNRLEGGIPSSFGNIKKLGVLDISNNNISGKLPESLALGSKTLVVLILSNNNLHGEISSAFFNITYMSILRLNKNKFTGNIPYKNVGFVNLDTLDLSENHLSGRLPTWIANISTLSTVVMRGNSFDGPISLPRCDLSNNIRFFDLSQNHLSGSIPSCLMRISTLRYLHLQNNKLIGPIPKSSEFSGLLTLDLSHNNFSGSFPKSVASSLNLRALLLKGNKFNGSIPRELCRLNKIGIMDLSNNMFSGSIPPCFNNITFGKTPAVELINEDFVWFTLSTYKYEGLLRQENLGSIAFYNVYTEEEEIEFMASSYKGDILTTMSGIDMSSNHLTGHIPLEIGSLTAIRALNLSHNQLTGAIPNAFSNLKQLELMDLSHNNLTGRIPSKLVEIHTLEIFSVAYNNLSGLIPVGSQFSSFGESSYEGNPFLCGFPLQKRCN